ncbi:hypothetical protein ACSW9O_15955 (plasmid) [Clostridium perfringens]|nr:hypothetical protein [Clostridium perfringens]
MEQIYRRFSNVLTNIKEEDYINNQENIFIGILISTIGTYMGKKKVDLINPIRIQQMMNFIKNYYSNLLELKNYAIYKVKTDLEDNINKDSIVIPVEYINSLINAWNDYVDTLNGNGGGKLIKGLPNIRNSYISTYSPCVGTTLKMKISEDLDNNIEIGYATYNVQNGWSINSIDTSGNGQIGYVINLDKNKKDLVLEVKGEVPYKMECNITRGASIGDGQKLSFPIRTYSGNTITTSGNYDLPFCLFFNNKSGNGLVKIKDLITMERCLNIENKNCIVITKDTLDYYQYLLRCTLDPSKIDYNNVIIHTPYPAIRENDSLKVYGKGYLCSAENIKYSNIKAEIDEGRTFIGDFNEIKKLFEYIDSEILVPYSLRNYVIEVYKINSNYVIKPNFK